MASQHLTAHLLLGGGGNGCAIIFLQQKVVAKIYWIIPVAVKELTWLMFCNVVYMGDN